MPEIDGDALPDEQRRRTLLVSAVGVAAVLTGIGVVLLTGADAGEEVDVALRAPRAVSIPPAPAPVAAAPGVRPPLPPSPASRPGRNPFDLPSGVVLAAPQGQVSALNAAPERARMRVPADLPVHVPAAQPPPPRLGAVAPAIPMTPVPAAVGRLQPAHPAAIPTTQASTPGTTPDTAPPSTPASTTRTAAPPVVPTTATSLTLTEVKGPDAALQARFRVNGVPVTVLVGHQFGPGRRFRLLSLLQGAGNRWTAVLQVGDARPQDLRQNVTIRLR